MDMISTFFTVRSGQKLFVLHSDSPHGMMGRSRWSESVVPYPVLTFMTRLFFRLLWASRGQRREGGQQSRADMAEKGRGPAELSRHGRAAEKGVPLPTVGLHPTGNWQRPTGGVELAHLQYDR